MATDSGNISRRLQDTFSEFQEQLLQDQRPSDTGKVEQARAIEEVLADLAKREGFEVEILLGVGGMGAVVRARDLKLGRTVALKFLPPELITNPKNAQELRGEAQIASRILHENIVHILSWHEVDDVPFFAMEFIEGESLDEFVKARGRLPAVEALRITGEAARGLQELHAAGIIHRDIKPANIMISRDGRVKITDFGISRTQDAVALEAQKTKIAGTPKFMAPEQARGEAATKQSDIYSLAATMYYMLTGRAPVEPSPDIRIQIANVREGRVIPIANVLPKVNRDVARLVMRSLSLNQSRRPLDAGSFRDSLNQVFLSQQQNSHGVTDFMKRWGGTIRGSMALIVGLAIGFFVRAETNQRSEDEGTVRVSTLGPLVQQQVVLLRQWGAIDQDANELANRLEAAVNANRASDLANLLPAAARMVDVCQVRLQCRAEQKNTASTLREQAKKTLDRLAMTQNQPDVEAAIREWRTSWIAASQTDSTLPPAGP